MKKFSFVLLIIFLFVFSMSSSASAGKIRVGVADFVDKTNNRFYQPQIRTDIFIETLGSSSNNLEAVGSKSFQALHGVTLENVANTETGCQYIVLGDLTSYHADMEGLSVASNAKKITYTISITVDTRLIETNTGKIILYASGTGNASHVYDKKEYSKLMSSKKGHDENINKQIELGNKAWHSAFSMVSEKICAFLTGEYPEVSSVTVKVHNTKKSNNKKNKKAEEDISLGTLNINRGTSSGVYDGTFYKIFFEGEEVFDINGNSLGREKFNVAVAEVKSAKTDYSTASVTGGIFENIREGDKAEQITKGQAQLIIRNSDFVKNRLNEFLN